MFQVTGLKILGGVGTHIFFYFFFWKKITTLCILKGISSFKMHKIVFFPQNLKKILGFTSKFRQGRVILNTGGPVTLNTGIFYMALSTMLQELAWHTINKFDLLFIQTLFTFIPLLFFCLEIVICFLRLLHIFKHSSD